MKRLSLAFFSLLAIAACAPRDVAVMSDADRAKLLNKGGGTGTVTPAGFRIGNYSLGAHMIEREAEAVQALRWILDPSLAEREGQQVTRKVERGSGSTLTEKASNKEVSKFVIESRSSSDVSEENTGAEGKGGARRWIVSGFALRYWTGLQDKTQKLELTDLSRRLQIDELAQPGQYRLIYEITGDMKFGKNGGGDRYQVTHSYDFDVVRGDGDRYSVTRGTAKMSFGGKDYVIKNDGRLEFSFGDCLKIEGQAVMTTGKPVTLLFSADFFKVGSSFSIPFEACAKRPVLDLYRLIADPVKPSKSR